MDDFIGINSTELMVIALIGVLILGKDLPQFSRKAGRYVVQFQNYIRGIKEEIQGVKNGSVGQPTALRRYSAADIAVDEDVPTAPKFIPPHFSMPHDPVQ